MNWFKHFTNLHNDPDIEDAYDLFGHAGYCVFFILHEMYGFSYNNVDNSYFLEISLNNLRRKTKTKSKTIKKVLEYFHNRNRIICIYKDDFVRFKIPEFIKLANNWTIENRAKLFSDRAVTGHIEERSKKIECRKEK